tara:strand:- start:13798 stop:14400 length:603 start_codon:yes stop_codon:yes gene_type:complete
MKKNLDKILARKKFIEIRVKEIKKTQLNIYFEVEDFINKFLCSNQFKKNQTICIYWPLEGEVDLRGLRNSYDLQFALPCCTKKGQIEYRKWSNRNLKKDACGIPAPIDEALIKPEDIAFMFVPALAIDQQGNRLGYGGGYFDKLRENPPWRSILTLVVLPESCVSINPLPCDQWDVPFQKWITENGISETTNFIPSSSFH